MPLRQDIERLVEERDNVNESIQTLSDEKFKLEENLLSINEELKLAHGRKDDIQHQISEVGCFVLVCLSVCLSVKRLNIGFPLSLMEEKVHIKTKKGGATWWVPRVSYSIE